MTFEAQSPVRLPGDTKQHVLAVLINPPTRRTLLLRWLLIALGISAGIAAMYMRADRFVPPAVYRKDLLQDYLLAKSVVDGLDPYVPLQGLVDRYVASIVQAAVDHPVPHPPLVGVLLAPLTLLDYPTAAIVWLAVQLAFLIASVHMLARAAGGRLSLPATLAIAIALVALPPVFEDLLYGQLMLLLVVLLAAARLSLLSERHVLGGVLIGLAILVKFIPWPLTLVFLMRRDWRAFFGSAGTVLAGYAVSIWIIGFDAVLKYFLQVIPAELESYRGVMPNSSVASLGWRLFEGTTPGLPLGVYWAAAPPLFSWPLGARVVSMALPALFLLAAWLILRRRRDQEAAFGVAVCLSVMISPVSWNYYSVLAIIPAAEIIRWLIRHRLPARETNLALLTGLLLLRTYPDWATLAFAIAGQTPIEGVQAVLPVGPTLVVLMPAVALSLLAWLRVRLSED